MNTQDVEDPAAFPGCTTEIQSCCCSQTIRRLCLKLNKVFNVTLSLHRRLSHRKQRNREVMEPFKRQMNSEPVSSTNNEIFLSHFSLLRPWEPSRRHRRDAPGDNGSQKPLRSPSPAWDTEMSSKPNVTVWRTLFQRVWMRQVLCVPVSWAWWQSDFSHGWVPVALEPDLLKSCCCTL